MKPLIKTISITCAVIILGFFVIAGVITYHNQSKLIESRIWVIQNYEIIIQLKQVLSILKDCETGQRGYLITGYVNYLEPYNKCHNKIDALIEKVESMMSHDQGHQENIRLLKDIQLLKSLTAIKLAELKQTIDLRREMGFDAARQVVISNLGKKTMDDIRSLLARMEATEQDLLAERLKLLDTEFAATQLHSFILIGLAFMVLMGMLVAIAQLVARREREMARLNMLYEIAQIIAESNDLQGSIKHIIGVSSKHLGWDLGAFWCLNTDKNELKCAGIWHTSGLTIPEFEALSRSITFKKGAGLPGAVWDSNKPIWISDIATHPNYQRASIAAKEGIHGAVAIPIKLSGELLGIIEFYSSQIRNTDDEIIKMSNTVGSYIAQFFERKKAEQALIEREARTHAILDTAAEGIITITAEGLIESANNAAHRIFNFPLGTLIEKSVTIILPEFLSIKPNSDSQLDTDPNKFIVPNIETKGKRLDDSTLPVEIALSVAAIGDQKITTGIVRDITERKEIERRVSEFYSTVSHELRTPLTSIRGSLSLMDGGRAGELPARANKLVKVARSESERLIRLINDILDIKKIEVGKLELHLNDHNPSSFVKLAIENLQGVALQAGVEIVAQINVSGMLACDKDRIDQVLTNLISNAIKFSPSGAKVLVKLDVTKTGGYRFSVVDNGPGIPQQQMHKLFGLFQQLEGADNRPKEGTGLGLAISKAIVELHQGTIGVESNFGQGSTFWFELPGCRVASAPLPALSKAIHSGPMVLIVEDDEKLCELLEIMLGEQRFNVVRAGTIQEATELLESGSNPDVIILDIILPDGNGLMFMDRLRQNSQTESTPIVILSGREADLGTYGHPLLIDWIKKPFEENRLLSAISLAVRKRTKGTARVLIVEDDEPTREIIKQNLESLQIECLEAADGIAAVHLAREKDPDLIVLDLGMPCLDGFEVVEILRNEKNRATPLIVYTARDLSDEDKKELSLGLTAHLIKSRTSEDQLIDTIKTMLNGLLKNSLAVQARGPS